MLRCLWHSMTGGRQKCSRWWKFIMIFRNWRSFMSSHINVTLNVIVIVIVRIPIRNQFRRKADHVPNANGIIIWNFNTIDIYQWHQYDLFDIYFYFGLHFDKPHQVLFWFYVVWHFCVCSPLFFHFICSVLYESNDTLATVGFNWTTEQHKYYVFECHKRQCFDTDRYIVEKTTEKCSQSSPSQPYGSMLDCNRIFWTAIRVKNIFYNVEIQYFVYSFLNSFFSVFSAFSHFHLILLCA